MMIMLHVSFAIESLLLKRQKDTSLIVEIWFIVQSLPLICDNKLKLKNKKEKKSKSEKKNDEKCVKQEGALLQAN